MTKQEYLKKLEEKLRALRIEDIEDIIEEYDEHFAFRSADGYSEEETSIRLGSPETIANQYAQSESDDFKKAPAKAVGLIATDFLSGILFIFLYCWTAVLFAISAAFLILGFCLLTTLNINGLIPPLPYHCAFILSISSFSLSVLSASAIYKWIAFVTQLLRSYIRFHQNSYAKMHGRPTLPPLRNYANIPAKIKRRLRITETVALCVLAVTFILGFALCAISAGDFQFWHIWGWFTN